VATPSPQKRVLCHFWAILNDYLPFFSFVMLVTLSKKYNFANNLLE
jgi:hypothetical protein